MITFNELGLEPLITQAVTSMGFEEATPIQEQTIPLVLMGKDLIGRAQTGTGKTAAYGIPLINICNINVEHIQGVVVTPTRELAIQVAEELNRIGHYKKVKSLPIYGGQEIERQFRALRKRPNIIVGTPGRLIDHIRRKTIRLQYVKMVVLDEADEMLNMGFIEDIETILQEMPRDRQNLLFSATIPLHIKTLARKFMKNPEIVHIAPKEVTVANIKQEYIETTEKQKLDVLCRLLDIQNPELAIVFCRTRRRVDEIAEALSERGYSAEGIHGELSQNRRDNIMRRFRGGEAEVLVATDVAARGLDITGVTNIYNFDIPQDPESYVHRIGRTGRAGERGLATTFVTPRELDHLKSIEKLTSHQISRKPVPTINEAFTGLQNIAIESLLNVVEKENTHAYKNLAESLLEEYDSVTLLSAAIKILTRKSSKSPNKELSEVPPVKFKKLNKENNKKGSFNRRNQHKASRSRPKQQ